MSWYTRHVFPFLCELALRKPAVSELRRSVLQQAEGDVLEIGFGSGLNLPHYPDTVGNLIAVDPNPGMRRRARRRLAETPIEVVSESATSEHLPFPDGIFDTAVSTFTMCSLAHVEESLAEICRVLKPGGRFLILEHGLSPAPRIARRQRRLNRFQRFLADNCHLTRDIRSLVTAAPFSAVQLDNRYLEKTPPTHGYLYYGFATR